MAFDFEKAINGEPTYCDGININTSFHPLSSTFYQYNFGIPNYMWDKSGKSCCSMSDLSTDPPKKKVKVTAYVYKDDNGQIAFAREKILREWKFLGEISGEVEI